MLSSREFPKHFFLHTKPRIKISSAGSFVISNGIRTKVRMDKG